MPKYGFMGWSPGPGSTISEFGTVYGVYSKGRDPAVVAQEKADAKKKAQQKKKKQNPQTAAIPAVPTWSPVAQRFHRLVSASACYNRLGR